MEIDQIPLFTFLPPEEVLILKHQLVPRRLPAGQLLFIEGDPGDTLSIILSGQVEVIKAHGTPDEWIVAVLGPGEFIGEMSLLYPDRLRSASIRTLTEIQYLEMSQDNFFDLLRRQPNVGLHIMREMSLRLRNSEDATIRDLKRKNKELSEAYQELQAAQDQLIEKERLEHELLMARKIQESILPRHVPEITGWKIAAHWQPAKAVSGDFYDFISLPDGTLGIIIGDVTDKGVPAALVMATTRSLLRYAALSAAEAGKLSPASVLAHVNDALCEELPVLMFVTCLFAILEPDTGRILFANAGQNLPYLCDGEKVSKLTATGMPLGLLPGTDYTNVEEFIALGSRLFLYSDGLVEAHNPDREMFGIPRLCANLSQNRFDSRGLLPQELINFILSELIDFTGDAWEQEDDVTIVILDRHLAAT